MARSLVLSLAVLATSCAYQTPTAPTPLVTSATSTAVAIRITGAQLYMSTVGGVTVGARDDQGTRIEADIICEPSSGQLTPSRFRTVHAADRLLELTDTTSVTTIKCRSGSVESSAEIDMLAWHLRLLRPSWDAPGPFAGLTTIQVWPDRRMPGVMPSRLSIDWGDGNSEDAPFVPLETAWGPSHRYARNGMFMATVRLEWPGGAVEARQILQGGPPVFPGHP